VDFALRANLLPDGIGMAIHDSDFRSSPPVRSIELMSAGDTALLVVDVQEKLIPLIPGHERLIWNIRRLLDGAKLLGIRSVATEQYPQGLGGTVRELADRLGSIPAKQTFSCCGCQGVFTSLRDAGIPKLLVVGIEAHVCVQQTVLDLLADGFRVYVAVDAIGSRFDVDRETAIRRMEMSGATMTTTEAALFEWCERSDRPEFKPLSAFIRESPPVVA
jgi:nicotinamidase-related amidase